jgi:hypothetical protein
MTSKAEVLNFKRRLLHSSETLYPISCAALSPSGAFLGLGLADGTVLVWDNLVNSERAYLDKHKLDVSFKCFNLLICELISNNIKEKL